MATTEVDVIRQEALTIPERAKLIVIKDQVTMSKGNEIFLAIKGLRKKIGEVMDPLISSAFQNHKLAVAKKKELEAPLIAGETWLNGQMTTYHQAQDRIRQSEIEKLRQEAIQTEMKRREKEEERKMAEAAILEAAGAKEEAEQLVNEAIQLKEDPVIIETKEPETPKVEMNGAAIQTNWKWEITDESKIPRNYMIPDSVKIGGVVRAMKENANIPGIRVWSDKKTRSTGR